MAVVFMSNCTEYGTFISQKAMAYEVRMTSKPPESQWRKNHVLIAVADSVSEAIDMCKIQYPDDPIIDQVVLRNRGMDLLISESMLRSESGSNS